MTGLLPLLLRYYLFTTYTNTSSSADHTPDVFPATAHPVWSGGWKAKVVPEVDALVTSCVVIPCSFTHNTDVLSSATLRGSWFLPEEDPEKYIFHEDSADIMDNFRGRTELTGRLREGNCTLKIMEVKDHDDGPFCFKVDMNNDGFSFVDDCARLNMLGRSCL